MASASSNVSAVGNITKTKYKKPSLSFQKQLSQLQARGLIVDNTSQAISLLSHINYFRLEAYWYTYYDTNRTDHYFVPGTNFNDIWRHYRFDRRLRALITRALERIEISFRTQFSYFLSQNFGPFPLNSTTLSINTQSWADELLELNKECQKSKELFAVHFFMTYTDPILPIWALVEILSFGKITNYYRQIKSIPIKNQISNIYGLDPNILTSWLTHLYYIRNTCAHHSRLWNKRLTVLPKPPTSQISKELHSHWIFPLSVQTPDDHYNERRLYNSILIIDFFLTSICPSYKWRSEITELIKSYSIDATRMGFPDGWEKDPFWQ